MTDIYSTILAAERLILDMRNRSVPDSEIAPVLALLRRHYRDGRPDDPYYNPATRHYSVTDNEGRTIGHAVYHGTCADGGFCPGCDDCC